MDAGATSFVTSRVGISVPKRNRSVLALVW